MILSNSEGASNFFSKNLHNNSEEYKSEIELLTHILSHDLKKPLRVLTNNSQELLQISNNDKSDELEILAQEIYHTSLELQKMINILLEYIRIVIFKPEYQLVNINEIIENVLLNLKDQIQQTKALINFNQFPNVIGHKKQLTILFENIIANSLKYIVPDVIPNINISYISHNNFIEFVISDNSIGIEEEYFEIVFLLFQRLHTQEEYSGLGTGLSIAKKIVEAHGGKIWLNSILNEGTDIHFTLETTQKEDNDEKL